MSRRNRRYYPPKYLFKATFAGQDIAAPLPNPLLVDIGGPTVFTDTAGNKASITGGVYTVAGGTAAGDPGLWTPAYTRVSGRAALFKGVTITDATAVCEFGYDANQAGALGDIGFQCNTDVLKGVLAGTAGPSLYVPLDATAYDLLVVPLSTGGLLLLKLSTASLFTLLFRSATGTITPVYAAMPNTSAAYTLDDWCVVDLSQFGSQWSAFPVYVAAPPSMTPTVSGIELVTNGDFSAWTGDNPDSWSLNGGPEDASNYVTQSPVGKARVVGDGTPGVFNGVYQNVGTVANTWYRYRVVVSDYVSGRYKFYVSSSTPTMSWGETGVMSAAGRAADQHFWLLIDGVPVDMSLDDCSIQAYNPLSMLGTAYQAGPEGWFEVGVTIPTGHVGGMMICLDDETNPQNYLLAYHDRTNLNVIECVAGVQTSLLATAATYGDGYRICLQKIGNTMRCFYGAADAEALIGAALTTTATTNTKMTTWGSDVTVTYANLAYSPAYHTLPSWA